MMKWPTGVSRTVALVLYGAVHVLVLRSCGQIFNINHPLLSGEDTPMICSAFLVDGHLDQTFSLLEAAILPFHSSFSLGNMSCSGFLGWEAYQLATALKFGLTFGAQGLAADLKVFSGVAFVIRDSCSSNLLAAAQVQTVLSVQRGDLPAVAEYGDGNVLIRDLDLNITLLDHDVRACDQGTAGSIFGCHALAELLEIATDADLDLRNETLLDLGRYVSNGDRVPPNLAFTAKDNARPASNSLFIPMASQEAIAISPLLSARTIIHISAWASSPIFNNNNEYPYFFRMTPSDDHQVEAIVDLITELGATYVALIAGADQLYSGQGYNLIRDRSRRDGKFCFAMQQRISAEDPESLEEAAVAIRNSPDARVIIIFATPRQMAAFIPVYNQHNITDRIIIGSSDWFTRLDYASTIPASSAFYKTTVLGFVPTPERIFLDAYLLTAGYSFELKQEYFARQTARGSPYARTYLERVGNCSISSRVVQSCQAAFFKSSQQYPDCDADFPVPDFELTIASVTLFMVRTLLSVTLASSSIQPYCRDGQCTLLTNPVNALEILRTYRELTLPCSIRGVNRTCEVFTVGQSGFPYFELQALRVTTANNDGRQRLSRVGVGDWYTGGGETYDTRLQWYTHSCVDFGDAEQGCVNMTARRQEMAALGENNGTSPPDNRQPAVPSSICSEPCRPGYFLRQTSLQQFCCWTCIRCSTGHFSEEVNSLECDRCDVGLVTNVNRTQCIEPIIVRWPWPSYWSWIVIALCLFGAALTAVVLVFFIRHRREPMILRSNIVHMTFVLGSAICTFLINIVLLYVPRSTLGHCHIHNMLFLLFTAASISALILKTNRLGTIFSSMQVMDGRRGGGLRRKLLSNEGQVFLILLFTFLFCILYYALREALPAAPQLVFVDEQHAGYSCRDNAIANGVLLGCFVAVNILAFYLAFQTRSLPDDYNDSKLIMVTSSICTIVLLAFLPALLNTELDLRMVVISLVIMAYHYAAVITLCLPRVYWTQFGFTENYKRPATSSNDSTTKSNGRPSLASQQVATPTLSNRHALVSMQSLHSTTGPHSVKGTLAMDKSIEEDGAVNGTSEQYTHYKSMSASQDSMCTAD
ncbi:extracellular calcium-sensing receptor-like [Sycon ciliatum]|uniref:extracellular calcium-sensing receptor-like n=1 Tax=Sycon ciliatum TaxID=27933 RepID=UPI0031F6477F